MNVWSIAYDDLNGAIEAGGGEKALTVDQRLQVAQIKALLSISQELSLIQDQGIQPEWSPRGD